MQPSRHCLLQRGRPRRLRATELSCSRPQSGSVTGPAPRGAAQTAVAGAPGGHNPSNALDWRENPRERRRDPWLATGRADLGAADSENLARARRLRATASTSCALTGLGSPYWDPEGPRLDQRITRGTTREQIARAGARGRSPSQSRSDRDVAGRSSRCCVPTAVRPRTGFLIQFQADVLGQPVDVAFEAMIDRARRRCSGCPGGRAVLPDVAAL